MIIKIIFIYEVVERAKLTFFSDNSSELFCVHTERLAILTVPQPVIIITRNDA